jgi:hypothetical protein
MDDKIRITLCLLATVLLCFAGTYYYIKESDSGNPTQNAPVPPSSDIELIEIESDSASVPPPGFRQTTVDEIHVKGLLTPSESFALAKQQGSVDEGITEGYSYASWISTYTKNGYKHADGGSRTGRTWVPGKLFLMARNACLWDDNPSIVFLRLLYKPDSTYYQTWGWNTQWVAHRIYPLNTTAKWHQRGWHKYSASQQPYETDVTKQY